MNLRLLTLSLHVFAVALAIAAQPSAAVEIAEAQYEGRPQFVVTTERAIYYFDRQGGGFSRLLDRDGQDWIAFHKEPLSRFPASAAAGYRGLPNLVFGRGNPDAGAGHPGFDRCTSKLVSADTIETETSSGKWAWQWEFSEHHATLTILRVDPAHPYWFLYEGPIGGKWSPKSHYFGTDRGGPRRAYLTEAANSSATGGGLTSETIRLTGSC